MAALTLAMLLLMPSLGCAGYGVLMYVQVVEPPDLHIQIGRAQLIGAALAPSPCQPPQRCEQAGAALTHRSPVYRVWLFIDDTDPYILLLVQLTLRPGSRRDGSMSPPWQSVGGLA
jgi:hypothetical protein